MDLNSDRIISNSIDIYNNIRALIEYNDNKIKLINKLKYKYYKNKLINIINKLSKSNQPLSKCNIYEIIYYTYSKFPVESGKFGCIMSTKEIYVEGIPQYMYTRISLENINASIKINESDDTFILNLSIKNDYDNGKSYYNDIILESMYSSNPDIAESINKLNLALIKTMNDFIIDTIMEE